MAIPPTHRVDVYRPTVTRDAKNTEQKTWPSSATLSGLLWNLQPATAGLTKQLFGRYVRGTWLAIVGTDDAIQEGDGVRVVAALVGGGSPPGRFEIVKYDPWGGYQADAVLQISGENFG